MPRSASNSGSGSTSGSAGGGGRGAGGGSGAGGSGAGAGSATLTYPTPAVPRSVAEMSGLDGRRPANTPDGKLPGGLGAKGGSWWTRPFTAASELSIRSTLGAAGALCCERRRRRNSSSSLRISGTHATDARSSLISCCIAPSLRNSLRSASISSSCSVTRRSRLLMLCCIMAAVRRGVPAAESATTERDGLDPNAAGGLTMGCVVARGERAATKFLPSSL